MQIKESTVAALAELQLQTWTYADLDPIPDHDVDWRCFQIVDGSLVVTPSPGLRHEYVRTNLWDLLAAARGPDVLMFGQMSVNADPSYLVPDIFVVRREVLDGPDQGPVPPALGLLAVEVVSPSSRTMDRIVKPAQYAVAGIPAYWRVETRPEVTLTAYELAPGATSYTEVGTWGPGQTAQLTRPFPVTVPIDTLIP